MLFKAEIHAYRNDNFVQNLDVAFEVDNVSTWDNGDLDMDWFWDTFGDKIRSENPKLQGCDLDVLDWKVEAPR